MKECAMTGLSLGIDFGTTNTVIALAGADGAAELVRFPAPEGEVFAFRSALSFNAPADRPSERRVEAGPWAIEAYVEDPLETRFIQSFKSFAASANFTETQILGRRYVFEDMLSAFLLKMREHAGPGLADMPRRVIVGRPVTFAGASPDEDLALTRYEAAFARLGFEEILYAYEPVGAAFFFARGLTRDATVLVGISAAAPPISRSSVSAARMAKSSPQPWAAPASAWRGTPSTTGSSTIWSHRPWARGRPIPASARPCPSPIATIPPSPAGTSWPCCGPAATCGKSANWSAKPMSQRRSPGWWKPWTRTTATSSTSRSPG